MPVKRTAAKKKPVKKTAAKKKPVKKKTPVRKAMAAKPVAEKRVPAPIINTKLLAAHMKTAPVEELEDGRKCQCHLLGDSWMLAPRGQKKMDSIFFCQMREELEASGYEVITFAEEPTEVYAVRFL